MIDNQVEEDQHLDYKSAKAIEDNKEIAKDVSAFANADGGVIIYGIKEYDEREKRHLPEAFDPITDIKKFSKERLEQIINSSISPRISGLLIIPVRLDKDKLDTIYVVEIPKSNTAHQNQSDLRYYRRYNFESLKMYDHEVRDVMFRKTYPKIDIVLKTGTRVDLIKGKQVRNNYVRVSAANVGGVYAKYLAVFLQISHHFIDLNPWCI